VPLGIENFKSLHSRLGPVIRPLLYSRRLLVSRAYGWSQMLSDEEFLARLLALNHERAAEEKEGLCVGPIGARKASGQGTSM
jgi:hypothetical protein